MKYPDFILSVAGTFGAGFLTMLFIMGMLTFTEFDKANIFYGRLYIIPIGAMAVFLGCGLYLTIRLLIFGKKVCEK